MSIPEIGGWGLSILEAASLRRKVVTPAKAGAGVRSAWVLDSGFRRNDGPWRAKRMTAIGWHGLAKLGRGMTAMPAGRTAGVTGGSVHGKTERPWSA
jgi:hypothetical protein